MSQSTTSGSPMARCSSAEMRDYDWMRFAAWGKRVLAKSPPKDREALEKSGLVGSLVASEGSRSEFWGQLGLTMGSCLLLAREVCGILGIPNVAGASSVGKRSREGPFKVDIRTRVPLSESPYELDEFWTQTIDRARRLRERLSSISETTLNGLHESGTWTKLPYPSIWHRLPQRVEVCADSYNSIHGYEWRYMGRARFEEIEAALAAHFSRSVKGHFWLSGTMGWGRSVCMTALVVKLMARSERRIIYIPDARILVENPTMGMKLAMTVAWANDEEAMRKIAHLESTEAIEKFFGSQHIKCIVIVDQYNSLDTSSFSHRRNIDTIENPAKTVVRYWLHRLATSHQLILCSSANDLTERFESIVNRPADGHCLLLNGGYNDAEMSSWWRDVLPDPDSGALSSSVCPSSHRLPAVDRDLLEELTERTPLLLNLVAKGGDFSPECKALRFIHGIVQEFVSCLLLSDLDPVRKHAHAEFVNACIRGDNASKIPSVDLVDHRFFYIDDQNQCRTLCPIVIDAAAKQLRMLGDDYHRVSVGDFLRVVDRFSTKTSVISFAIKAAVLSQMSLTGLPLPKLKKALPTEMFSIKIPHFRTDRDGLTMFTPAQFNFPFIDAIICDTSITNVSWGPNIGREDNLIYRAALFPVQIALTPRKHKNSELGFFKKWEEWTEAFNPTLWEVMVEFVCIGPVVTSTVRVKANTIFDPDTNTTINHPAFTRRNLQFKNVSRLTDLKLVEAGLRSATVLGPDSPI